MDDLDNVTYPASFELQMQPTAAQLALLMMADPDNETKDDDLTEAQKLENAHHLFHFNMSRETVDQQRHELLKLPGSTLRKPVIAKMVNNAERLQNAFNSFTQDNETEIEAGRSVIIELREEMKSMMEATTPLNLSARQVWQIKRSAALVANFYFHYDVNGLMRDHESLQSEIRRSSGARGHRA